MFKISQQLAKLCATFSDPQWSTVRYFAPRRAIQYSLKKYEYSVGTADDAWYQNKPVHSNRSLLLHASYGQFTPPRRDTTKQFCPVGSGDVNWALQSYLGPLAKLQQASTSQ